MERYLLFDAECMMCSNLAIFIEEESNKRLIAQSIQDPKIQSILDEIQPDRKWEPSILEITHTRTRLLTGMMMKMYALKLLGIRSGVRILQRVEFEKQRAIVSQSSTSYQTPRRQFLKNAAIVGTIWLGGNRGQASAANINSDSRILMAQLSPDDAIIKALQSTLVSRQAVSSFGELAWDHMYKLSSNIPGQVGYMIPSSSTPSYLIYDFTGKYASNPGICHPNQKNYVSAI